MATPIRDGQIWKRRVEISGDRENVLKVVGVQQITAESAEIVLRPVIDGDEQLDSISAPAYALEEMYVLVRESEPIETTDVRVGLIGGELGKSALGAWQV